MSSVEQQLLSSGLDRVMAAAAPRTCPPPPSPQTPPSPPSPSPPAPGAAPGRSAVCRNLFGPIDHDELWRETRLRLRESAERDRRRWNFDFQTDTPLAGPFLWEPSSARDSPGFYWETVRGRGKGRPQPAAAACQPQGSGLHTHPQGSHHHNQENRADNLLQPGSRLGKHSACSRRIPSPGPGPGPGPAAITNSHSHQHTYITEYFAKKKKLAGSKGPSENMSLCPPVPGEQTPRKRIR